jgi:hypothetical protein
MKSKVILVALSITILLLMAITDTYAQCPMCKMSAESNLAAGGTEGKGLNTGILYLLALPYLMVGVLAYVWYKKRTVNRE